MKLLIRNLTVADGDETLLDNASYTFYQENVYCINAAKKYKNALFNSIAYVRQQEGGEIELICDGQNCIMPAMVSARNRHFRNSLQCGSLLSIISR